MRFASWPLGSRDWNLCPRGYSGLESRDSRWAPHAGLLLLLLLPGSECWAVAPLVLGPLGGPCPRPGLLSPQKEIRVQVVKGLGGSSSSSGCTTGQTATCEAHSKEKWYYLRGLRGRREQISTHLLEGEGLGIFVG